MEEFDAFYRDKSQHYRNVCISRFHHANVSHGIPELQKYIQFNGDMEAGPSRKRKNAQGVSPPSHCLSHHHLLIVHPIP